MILSRSKSFMSRRVFPDKNSLQVLLKVFAQKILGKHRKKTSMTEENMVAIYDLGFSCKNSVQKDFKNKILEFFTCVTILNRNTFTKMMSYLHVPYYLQNTWS